MAKMTLLQMVQQACGEMGLPKPMSVQDTNDAIAVQMLALSNREGRECTRKAGPVGGWPVLRKENVFAAVPGQAAYALPADFDRMISQTEWDRGFRWQMLGPLQPAEWQVLKSGLSPTGPRRRFRLMGGQFYLDPTPADTNTLVYEYYSANFVQQAAGTTSSTFVSDGDTYLLPDDLMVLGLIWRWRRAKGLDYAQEAKTYDDMLSTELGRAAGARPLMLNASDMGVRFIGNSQIPDTGFGQ